MTYVLGYALWLLIGAVCYRPFRWASSKVDGIWWPESPTLGGFATAVAFGGATAFMTVVMIVAAMLLQISGHAIWRKKL